jgi:hypothetical protein
MKIYLGKDRQHVAQHVTVTELMWEIGCGHKYMDNFFSSPELFDDLAKKQTIVGLSNRRGMPQDLALKTTKLKRGDFCIRTRADLMAILWQDKREICTLMNIHDVPVEGNFCSEGGKAITVIDYNHHMRYVDKSDRMANSYSISRRTFKRMKKLFFHLLDLTIPNSYILHSSYGGSKISHRDF